VLRYGLKSGDARVRGDASVLGDGRTAVAVYYDGECLGDVVLRVPGLHNVRNALAAISSGLALGASLDGMRVGLEAFTGVDRRFQRIGEAAGVLIIDDYAHHPTEVAATLAAARSAFQQRRIVVAFQPHLFSRTRDFAREFGDALRTADVVLLADIYPAREQPIAGVTSDLIAAVMERAGAPPEFRGAQAEVATALARLVRPGDVVITMGAGDITRSGPELLRRLTRDA
jgi:UDP-N-acetylmuramate--alanine ligase